MSIAKKNKEQGWPASVSNSMIVLPYANHFFAVFGRNKSPANNERCIPHLLNTGNFKLDLFVIHLVLLLNLGEFFHLVINNALVRCRLSSFYSTSKSIVVHHPSELLSLLHSIGATQRCIFGSGVGNLSNQKYLNIRCPFNGAISYVQVFDLQSRLSPGSLRGPKCRL